jgi:hypothetical protein
MAVVQLHSEALWIGAAVLGLLAGILDSTST